MNERDLDLEYSSFHREEGEKLSPYHRLLDCFSLLLVVYFFTLSWFLPVPLTSILSEFPISLLPTFFLDKILLPLLLSFFWFITISFERRRLTRAFFTLHKLVSRLSYFQRAFYGLNAIIALFLFVLPMASTGLAVFLLFYLPFRVAKSKYFRDSKRVSLVVFVLLFLFLGIFTLAPLLKLTYFLSTGWLTQLFNIWLSPRMINIIHGLSLSIGAAGSITSFILFVYEGAQEYDSSIRVPHFKVNCGGFLLTLIFASLTLYFHFYFPAFFPRLLLFLSILVLIYSFETFLRWCKGLGRVSDPLGNASLLLFFLLSIAGLGASKWILGLLKQFHLGASPELIKIGSILGTTVIFYLTFLIALKSPKKKRQHPYNFQVR